MNLRPHSGRPVLGRIGPRAAAQRHPLIAELVDVADRQVDRHGPALGLPVVAALGVDPPGRRRGGGVAEEGLDEGLADVGPVVVAGVGERPDVVGQHAVGVAVLLLEQQGGRARAPFLGPQIRLAGRPQDGRTDGPDQAVMLGLRREEEALGGVAEAERGVVAGIGVLLLHDRHDGADDQVPVLVQRKRDHRLDVQGVAAAVLGAVAAVVVLLERHADQVGDRIGQLLGQFGAVVLGVGQGGARQQATRRGTAGGARGRRTLLHDKLSTRATWGPRWTIRTRLARAMVRSPIGGKFPDMGPWRGSHYLPPPDRFAVCPPP
jgi:hypothetical protein